MSKVQMVREGRVVAEATTAQELVQHFNANFPAWSYELIDDGNAIRETIDSSRGIVYQYELRQVAS